MKKEYVCGTFVLHALSKKIASYLVLPGTKDQCVSYIMLVMAHGQISVGHRVVLVRTIH